MLEKRTVIYWERERESTCVADRGGRQIRELRKREISYIYVYLDCEQLFCGKFKVGNDPGTSVVLVASKGK